LENNVKNNRATDDGVSVLIVSNRGAEALKTPIQSVLQQDFDGRIHIVVVGDNPEWRSDDLIPDHSDRFLFESFALSSVSTFRQIPTVMRVARLRNVALAFAREGYVCFLDDDNSWSSDHLSSLHSLIKASNCEAVHSWRQLVDADGKPWVPTTFPWGHDPERKRILFDAFVEAGLMDRSSNVLRDSANIIVDGEEIASIDMGAWLFHRPIVDSIRFETEYSDWEIENSITEDDKLLATIKARKIPLECTRNPSLLYRLGGYSNRRAASNGR
jgi:glycosyltransferase involved in cell wall biosynthesis